MRSRSRSRAPRKLLTLAFVGAVLVPLPRLVPTVAQATTVIIQEGDVQREDLYAFGSRVLIEGVVEGDLVFAARDVIVTGRVEGDLLGVAWDQVVVAGEVGGSLRVASRNVTVAPGGRVGDDVAALGWSVNNGGEVGRDLLATAGGLGITGEVGRDVRGQVGSLRVGGTVARSMDVAVRSLALDAGARVGGDVAYRADAEAAVGDGAEIAGQVFRRDARATLWRRAAGRVTGIFGVLGLVVAGLVLAWLLRRTWLRAATTAGARPWAALGAGVAFAVIAPVVAVGLALTIVGIPLAVLLAGLWLGALFFGPIPALAAAGTWLLRRRGGLLAGFVVAALAWRAVIWLLPVGGAVLYMVVAAWGSGAWLLGAWAARADARPGSDDPFLLPPTDDEPVPPDWEPPLAPRTPA